MPKLTRQLINTIKPPDGKADLVVWDDQTEGFGVRVKQSRGRLRRTFVVQARDRERRSRRATIGRADLMGLDQAREIAKRKLREITESAPAAQPAPTAPTLGELVSIYIKRKTPEFRAEHQAEVKRILEKVWAPLHDRRVDQLHRRDVSEHLDKVRTESGQSAARHARDQIRALLDWAVPEGYVDSNVAAATHAIPKGPPRTRSLTEDELRLVWHHAGSGHFGWIVRLLILTGQRRDQVATLTWSEIDPKLTLWTIPPSKRKITEASRYRGPHLVPLSLMASLIIKGMPWRVGREYLFGEGDGGYSGWSRAKAAMDARLALARAREAGCRPDHLEVLGEAVRLYRARGKEREKLRLPDRQYIEWVVKNELEPVWLLPPWSIHDLRRTVRTMMVAPPLSIPDWLAGLVQDHVTNTPREDMGGVYNQYSYLDERRDALNRWGERVVEIIDK